MDCLLPMLEYALSLISLCATFFRNLRMVGGDAQMRKRLDSVMLLVDSYSESWIELGLEVSQLCAQESIFY